MRSLWIRFSLIIGAFFLLLLFIPITLFVIDDLWISLTTSGTAVETPDFQLRDIPESVGLLILFVAVVGCGLGVWLSKELTRPIAEISTAAKNIGQGDLTQRVPVPTQSVELHQLATTFNEMADQLQSAEVSRTNLLADVSHELRTPLTVLSGRLRASLDDVSSLNEAEIANLYSQTQHLIRLVEDLHLLAKAEAKQLPMQIESLEMGQLLEEIGHYFQPLTAEEGIDFLVQLPIESTVIEADKMRIRQIFSNLLGNALRHTPEGGSIYLRGKRDENRLICTIQDTGEGISAEHLPHLLSRFYRVDDSRTRSTGGSGLGLPIVHALVQAHDGTLQLDSAGKGEGTIVTITFPISKDHNLSGDGG